jgi:glycosyltransferase involved in cell wall biosynthesis
MRAVDVLRGEGLPAEVLVIDDASRDGSQTMLRQLESLYYDAGLRCLAFCANGGLSASRNQALNYARYRYFVFLDADNEVIPENLPLFIRTLEQTHAAAAYGNLLLRTPTAHHAHSIMNNESFQTKQFGVHNYIDAFSVWDSDQLRDAGGYDTSLNIVSDWEIWLHLATNGRKIVFVPAVLGYYYILPVSMVTDQHQCDLERARLRRIFNQVQAREFLTTNTCHLRYHPALGYL